MIDLDTIVQQLNWRAAIKGFNPDKKVSESEFEKLMEAVRLSPSSLGLQPWKFVVVKNPDTRLKLREAGYNQPQITEASHLVVLCAQTNLSPESVERYIQEIASVRGVELDTLADFKQMILESITNKTAAELIEWNARQVYIALGVLLSACAMAGIDACPMEGFDKGAFDNILDLQKLGVTSYALCAIGYRGETDWISKVKKVRFPKEEVIVEIK